MLRREAKDASPPNSSYSFRSQIPRPRPARGHREPAKEMWSSRLYAWPSSSCRSRQKSEKVSMFFTGSTGCSSPIKFNNLNYINYISSIFDLEILNLSMLYFHNYRINPGINQWYLKYLTYVAAKLGKFNVLNFHDYAELNYIFYMFIHIFHPGTATCGGACLTNVFHNGKFMPKNSGFLQINGFAWICYNWIRKGLFWTQSAGENASWPARPAVYNMTLERQI